MPPKLQNAISFVFGALISASLISSAYAASAIGSKMEDGRVFLFEQPIEGVYYNMWSGLRVSDNSGDQVEVHVRGEGKTVEFDGILSINCLSASGYYWKTASNFGEALTEGGLAHAMPLEVLANAKQVFCTAVSQ